jgi:glycosyltransferase involved in cell wall biosynthesis
MQHNQIKNIELSVVVLCYHSETFVESFVDQLEKEIQSLDITYELVLVANYDKNSPDDTPQIVKKIAAKNKNIIVLADEKEGGMGWDMRSGLSAASGNYIAVIDGDAQMPSSDIPMVYHLIKAGNYDLVKTYRAKRYDGIIRIILSKIYNILFSILYSSTLALKDINSKPKIFTKTAYQKMQLRSNDWFTDAEIMIEALKYKMKICEVSTVFYKNERRSSFVGVSTVFEFIYNLFYYRFKR